MIHDQELIVEMGRSGATSEHNATEDNIYVPTL